MSHRLVSSLEQAHASHAAYVTAMKRDPEDPAIAALLDSLNYVQSWIVVHGDNGQDCLFAPSKFVGYVGMTPERYAANHKEMDGRETERALLKWLRREQSTSSRGEAMMEALHQFCARFSKRPNGRCRLSTLRRLPEQERGEDASTAVADAIVCLWQTLPDEQLREVKGRLGLR